MKTTLKIAIAIYLIVMVGCVIVFFVQQSVVYGNHIKPGRETSHSPVAVTFRDKQSGQVHEAEITFVNDSIATNPLRMGNEIEEHLLSLMTANLATGLMLLVVAFSRANRPVAGTPIGLGGN
jgi:hypothetical protein